jgi:hypothetical protein
MTTIVVAAGLCSAIRPKLLTALPPKRHPSVQITAWGEGHWHIPCPDGTPFPDSDPWVKKHIANIDVNGDLTYVKLIEYIVCRLIEMENKKPAEQQTGYLYLMSTPLEPRNQKWAAKWDSLPDPGEWRQPGCNHKIPGDWLGGLFGGLFSREPAPAPRKRATRQRRERRRAR